MKKCYLVATFLLCALVSWTQNARVQIIHNSPTPGTDAGPVVDIYVNGALLPALTAVEFRTGTAFLDVPAETDIEVAVAVNPSNSVDDAIATFPLGQLADGGTYIAIAHGIVGDTDTPFTISINDSAREAAADSELSDVSIFHGSPGAPAVDVDARTVATLVTDLAYGEFTDDYVSVPPDVYYLDVKATGSPDIVATFRYDLSAFAGGASTVFASGILGGQPSFGLYWANAAGDVFPVLPQGAARVQVIHNSPSPTVDIYANGTKIADDFAFRTATPFFFVESDVSIDLAVALADSESADDAIAVFENNVFENGETYVITANGIVGDADFPFTLAVNAMGKERPDDETTIEFAALHGSPGAPNVDIDARTVGNLIADLEYGEYSDYLAVDPGLYYIDVRAAGDPGIVATFEADLNVENVTATVFASGLLGGDPAFGLFAALPDGTVIELPAAPVARVQVIHNSPSPTVDIYANGELLLDDFAFQEATPFIFLPAEADIDLAVALDNSTSADDAITVFEDISFINGSTYVVVANGIVGDADFPFTLDVNDMGQERGNDPSLFDVSVLHGSPGAPNVDVTDFVEGPLVSDLEYGQFTPYVGIDPVGHVIEIRAAGSPDLVGSFFINLTGGGGGSAVVFASGILGDEPAFNLLAALPDGTVIPFVPAVQVQFIHNSPAADVSTVDVYANGNLIGLADDLSYREATPYAFFTARSPIDFGFAAGDSQGPQDILITFEDVVFEDGKVYTIIANGIPGDADTPFELAVNDNGRTFAADPAQIDLTVFHGSQNAPGVDVTARGVGELIDNLEYGAFSDVLSVAPDTYYLEIRPDGSNDLVATFEADINGLAGAAGTVFASGLLGDDPNFGLFVALADGTVVPLQSVVRVQVVHNSPAPTVDVYANDDLLIPDFEFRTATPFVDLPARTPITLDIAPGDSQSSADAIASFEDIVFEDGTTYIVTAAGVVGDPDTPFGLGVYVDARERAADGTGVDLLLFHGSPDAPTVDAVVDGVGVLFDDISYSETQGYVNVPASTYVVNITPGDDNNTIVKSYDADLTGLEGGAAYLFASGFLTEEENAFEVWVALPDGTTFPLSEIVNTNELANLVEGFGIAPNPVKTVANVQYTLTESMQVTLNIYDATGKLISSNYIGNQVAGVHNIRLNANDLAEGMYNYSLVTDKGILTRKFIVTK